MLNPSTYKFFGDREPVNMTWQDIFAVITSTTNRVYQNTVASRKARHEGRDKEADTLKMKCGMFTPCSQCHDARDEKHIVGLTMVGMGDIDHIPLKDLPEALRKVKADPHTMMAFITNSGEGIRILFRWGPSLAIPRESPSPALPREGEGTCDDFVFHPERETHVEFLAKINPFHRAAWEVGTRYYAELTGFPTDKSCKDAVRASFFCHDSEAYMNIDAVPFKLTEEDVKPYLKDPKKTSETDSSHAAPVKKEELLNAVISDKIDFAIDEGLVSRLLEKYPYQKSGRHHFWLVLGSRLRYFGHSRYEFAAYKQFTLDLLSKQGLVLSDDPSVRKPHEIEDCMEYGFEKGEEAIETRRASYSGLSGASGLSGHSGLSGNSGLSGLSGDSIEEEVIENCCPVFPDRVYQNLPEELWQGLTPIIEKREMEPERYPRRRQDVLLMSLLTNYSVLCAQTHILYETHDYSPNLSFICLSTAGNGKSTIGYGFRIVDAVDEYLERTSTAARKEYEKRKEEYEQIKGKGARDSSNNGAALPEMPEKPEDQLIEMPGTTSRSQFTICMHSMGDYGLIINSSEIRTICSTLKLDVGDFSDLLCKATMNEQIDQFFKIDDRRIKIKHPKLSICLSGNFEQFHEFIRTLEDGLFSRFMFLLMEPHMEWISQKPNPKRGDYSDLFRELAEDAKQMWFMLRQCPTWVYFSDSQWKDHDLLWGGEMESLKLEGGDERVAVITRHGISHARIAAVLTVLRKWNEFKRVWTETFGDDVPVNLEDESETNGVNETNIPGDSIQDSNFRSVRDSIQANNSINLTRKSVLLRQFAERYRVMVCRDDDWQTARDITEVLLQHALHLCTTVGKVPQKYVQPMVAWSWAAKCLDDMKHDFTSAEYIERAQKEYGKSRAQAYRSLREARRRKLVIKDSGSGNYAKTPKCDNNATSAPNKQPLN